MMHANAAMQHMEASDSALPDDVVAKLVGARTAQVRRFACRLCVSVTHRSGRRATQRLGARRHAFIRLPSSCTGICRDKAHCHHPPQCSRQASLACPRPIPAAHSCRLPSTPLSPSPSDEVAEERCAGRVVDAQGRRWHTVAFPPPAAAAVAPLARDAPESVRARLRTYAPLAGATCDVDGGQAPLDVFKDVLKAAC